MENSIQRNYALIFKNVLTYLPSRFLIMLNSVIIIPLFTYLLNEKDMSIYLIALQILNLICTCSFDWITKAVLRFYEKYNINKSLDTFFSSILWISIIVYAVIFSGYFIFKDLLLTKFAIDNTIFLLTLFLVVPCGIRQFLYQILRVRNKAKLYTFTILLYQLSFIVLFLGIAQIFPNAQAILLAMNIAIFFIDIYIISTIMLNYKIKFYIDLSIAMETLKYAMPLIVTNSCYWFVFNFSKLIFQHMHEYLSTAITGVSWMLSESIIQPLVTVFIFACFPVIIKKFEHKKIFKPYFTNMIQLYCFLLIPVVSIFCFYSKEIVELIFPKNYYPAHLMLPFFALSIFMHELMKLINIKYHLKNRTYIEMILGAGIASVAYFANLFMINKYAILGAAVAMFLTECTLIFTNIFIKFKSLDYINYKKVSKTFILTSLIGLIAFSILHIISIGINPNMSYYKIFLASKIIIFTAIYYVLTFKCKEKILS